MNCSFNIRYKPRTTRQFTKSDLTVYDSAGNTALNALTVYGKSEVVDGAITSAGEGWATVDLGTLSWNKYEQTTNYDRYISTGVDTTTKDNSAIICAKYEAYDQQSPITPNKIWISTGNAKLSVTTSPNGYTDATAFKNSLNGVLLCYQLADPTQGNCIAVKTDNGTGINGTMAVFSTGTPLRGIPDTNVRDVMAWDGSAGTVTKNCASIDLGSTNNWGIAGEIENAYYLTLNKPNSEIKPYTANVLISTSKYQYVPTTQIARDKSFTIQNRNIMIHDTDYTDVTSFIASLSGVKLVYELATPTTEQLTTTENASIAGLRTFAPQTHAQNNAGAEMTVDYTIRVPTI